MRLVLLEHKGYLLRGVLEGETVRFLDDGESLSRVSFTERVAPVSEVKLLAPIFPSKIVALGLNYRDHAEELGMPLPEEPLIFLKPSTAVVGPAAPVILPRASERVDYEAELAVVVKKPARNVPKNRALDYVLGYTCFNDVTARDLQEKDVQFTRSKSFDTFAPLGPWIETEFDPRDVGVRAYVNGELRQDSTTGNLVFDVPHLISFISGVMTLLPGDVIATGTPSGIGPMKPGDEVTVEVEGLGSLTNTAIREEEKTP